MSRQGASPISLVLILLFAGLSASLTFALCRKALPLGQFLGVMDVPSSAGRHKQHAAPTPAVGGVILAIAGVFTSAAMLPWTITITPEKFYIRLTSAAIIFAAMVIGFVDDRRPLGASARLVLGALLATALLLLVPNYLIGHISFPSIQVFFLTGVWALPFTVLCLLALKNAINMTDGRNGLLLGLSIFWTIFFTFHATPAMVPGLISVLAALLVLFAFNWRGKLFMGDCGSYGLAAFFGILALSLHRESFGTVATAEIVLLFLIPILDTARLICVRTASCRSPLAPDLNHLHHLLDRAIGWRRGWLVYMLITVVPLAIYQLLNGHGVHIISGATIAYAVLVLRCARAAATSDPHRRIPT